MRLLDRLKRDCQRTTMVRPSGTMGGYFIADDDGETLHLPIVGPAHAPVVLDGVTVEELANELLGSHFLGPTPDVGIEAAVYYILNRLSVRVPRATIRAQVKMVECERCFGQATVPAEGGTWKSCPRCLGRMKVPTLTVKEDVPLPAKDGAWLTLAILAEGE